MADSKQYKLCSEACKQEAQKKTRESRKENDEILQIMDSTYDVKTTKSEYRITIQYVVKDTANNDNVGIHSLYIIKTAEDITSQSAYWGDGKHTPGINIGIKNAE